MARQPRLVLPDALHHLLQRGNNRQPVFVDDEDRRSYLDALREATRLHGVRVHAYVLMPDHVHLLVTPQREDSLARALQTLGRRYVVQFNRRHGRSGTLWEGRFRSCLTQTEDYVLACYRYIELNPVRAAMVSKPQDFRWTSFHANAMGKANPMLTPHDQYRRLGRTDAERRQAYRALFRAHLDEAVVEEIRSATNGNYALGDKRFQAQIEAALGRRAIRGVAGRPPKAPQGDDRQQTLL